MLNANQIQCNACRIKTGHSNLASCFGPRMRALAKVFYRGESRGKIPCQRPNPKFKLFGDSSQVRAIDNGITCCYWLASLNNRLCALKAHSSLLKCCAKNCPNYMYWIQGKHRSSWILVFLRLSVSLKLIVIVPFNVYFISIYIFF